MSVYIRYAFYPIAVVLAAVVVVESREADRLLRLAAEMQSLSGATRMAWASLLERLSFSWYSGATELADAYTNIVAQAGAAKRRGVIAGLVLTALAGVHLAIAYAHRAPGPANLAWHLNLVAVIALAVGVVAPMLNVVARSQVPVLGEVILRYDTKSIVSTIADLGGGGNWLLAGAIALFSLLVPLTKVVLVFLVMMPAAARGHTVAITVLNAIGKWSMADVFVVAVLVAFLAVDKDPHSSAEVGLGLYFFATYCGFSMFAAVLTGRANSKSVPAGAQSG